MGWRWWRLGFSFRPTEPSKRANYRARHHARSKARAACCAPSDGFAFGVCILWQKLTFRHRAKFRRAKQMVGADAMSMNEILGISSAETSARNSPISEPGEALFSQVDCNRNALNDEENRDDARDLDKTKTSEQDKTTKSKKDGKKESSKKKKQKSEKVVSKTKNSDKKKGIDDATKSEKNRKGYIDGKPGKEDRKDKTSKKKKDCKDKPNKKTKSSKLENSDEFGKSSDALKRKRQEDLDDYEEVESNVHVNAAHQFVYQYLSNKLMRKKAEVARRRCERGQWW